MNNLLSQLRQIDTLASELSLEIQYLLKYASYRQFDLDLALVEYLACNQQKYQHMLRLAENLGVTGQARPLHYQRSFNLELSDIISGWQQHRELSTLESKILSLLRTLIEKYRPHEQNFYHLIDQKITQITSGVPGHNPHG